MIEIDKIDKRILFELERNARIADVTLAKIVKKSKDAVRYRIKRLEEQKIITGYKTWIDMAKLGYNSATLYFNLLNIAEKKSRLIDYLTNDKNTYWIGVAEGAWNIGVSYFVKSNEELFRMKHELISKFGDIITDVKTTTLVSVSIHEKNFLIDEKTKLNSFTEQVQHNKLDEVSIKVLKEIYWNARSNVVDIAGKLKTTVDVVRTRLKNLKEDGIIIRYSAAIDYQKIGYEYHKAFIYLKEFDSTFFNEISRYVENSKTAINMVRQIAPWDIEIVFFTNNFTEFDNAISEITKKFEKYIKKTESATMSKDVIFPCSKLPF